MSVEGLRDLVSRGEFLLAHDLASQLLEERRDDPEVAYFLVLALARSGAVDRAEARFAELGLDRVAPAAVGRALAEDIDALFARLAKDRALRRGALRADIARVAAGRYERAFDRHHGAYPCINAATMWLVAGDVDRSQSLARTAFELAEGDDYWSIATRAEAALVLHDFEAAHQLIDTAARTAPSEYAARAATTRQLELIADIVGVEPAITDALRNPPVVHFAGHRIAAQGEQGRFAAEHERSVAARVGEELDARTPAFGFGALASGGDILVAEALLDRGAELHVLLPFAVDDFVRVSVAPAGDRWIRRFRRCLDRATSVSLVTDGPDVGDDVAFQLCSAVAMGDVLRHARQLETTPYQLVVWDSVASGATPPVGTAADVRTWATTGFETRVVSPAPGLRVPPREVPDAQPAGGHRRALRAVLFADIAGFSSLTDLQMPRFMDDVMGALAKRVDEFGDEVLIRRTWGDGIHLAFASVDVAAACAVALQRCFASVDLTGAGLDTLRGLRIGAHVGPVFEEMDPITGEMSYMGSNVTRAARVEPGTPEGEVYVTHPFAALAELEGGGRWSCQYVGRVPAAKDYGRVAMYLLRPGAAEGGA